MAIRDCAGALARASLPKGGPLGVALRFSKLLGQDLAAISVQLMVSAVVVIEGGVERFHRDWAEGASFRAFSRIGMFDFGANLVRHR
jgi:hypothetical protein